MDIDYGKGQTSFGPGVRVTLTGDEVATAIQAYLVAHGVYVNGPRTVIVNGDLCVSGEVRVSPSGFIVAQGELFSGKGPR